MLHSNWWCKIRVSLLLCFPFIFNLTIKVSLKVSFSQLVTTVWCENLPNYPKNLLEFGVVSILIKCFCRLSFIQVDSIKVEGIKQRSAGLVLFIQDISSSFIKMLKTCHSIWFNHLKMFSKNCNSHFFVCSQLNKFWNLLPFDFHVSHSSTTSGFIATDHWCLECMGGFPVVHRLLVTETHGAIHYEWRSK